MSKLSESVFRRIKFCQKEKNLYEKTSRENREEITHVKGGRNYAAVLVDLDQRKPIAFLEKRNQEVIAMAVPNSINNVARV